MLDAFHSGDGRILGVTNRGYIEVEYRGVTGFGNNRGAGYEKQPTNVFLIKGESKVRVVPTTPMP